MEFDKIFNKGLIVILTIVVLFSLYASLVPTAQTSGDSLNDSNQCGARGCFYNSSTTVCQVASGNTTTCALPNSLPLSGLFGSSGLIFVIVMAMLLIVIFRIVKGKK